jgi:hypothetical protein
MSWIDDSRREAFEKFVRVRAERRTEEGEYDGTVGDLNRALPVEIKKRALEIGNEYILCYEDALQSIAIASGHRVAVLGFESGEVLDDGYRVVNYSGYDEKIEFAGDWDAYVAAINAEAEGWIQEHPLGRNYGYVLTSTSEREFAEVQRLRRS